MLYQPPTGGAANDPYVGANPGAGIVGSKVPPKAIEHQQRELIALITNSGLTPSEADLTQVAKAVQSGKMNYAVATGTANAWIVAPALALAAYAAGRVLWIKAPATNSATTVTANISALGTRPVKKSDGTDPQIGDLISGRWYPTIDDGTNICVVAQLPSDRLAQLYLGLEGSAVSQSITSGTVTRISGYTAVVNNLPAATYSGGTITLGTTGKYLVSANLNSLLPDIAGSYGASIAISKVDGSNNIISSVAAQPIECLTTSPVSTRAGSSTALARLASGDRIAAFFTHNRGANLSVSVSLDIEFRGA